MANAKTTSPATPSAHTPGPWRTDWLGDDRGWILDEAGNYLAEIVTADDCGFVVSKDQQQANADLMSAAPDLLEALDLLLGCTIDQDLAVGNELDRHEAEAHQKALAAIAKANGTQPDHE